ncbi:hypothetical protein BGX28_000860 [Mortierella sp. GBA30]|nr:hypothetical protein BGX28_000860 [Mortierella sp. GBA30]
MADHHLSTICENKSICKKLRRAKFLDLSNNLLTEEGINILHSKVFYKDCSTQILDLSGNSILDSDAVTAPTPQHASHRLLSYRLSCSSLTHLRLSHLDLELVSHVVQAFPYIQSLIIWNLSPFRHAAKPGIISKSPVEKSFYDLCKALKCSTPLMELEIYSDKSFWVLARKVLAFKTVTMGGDDAGWKNVLLWRKHLNQCLKARTDPLKRFHWTGITDFKQHHHDVAD